MPTGILALDQGTSGSRAIVIDREGRVLGAAAQDFPQHFPQPGYVEHDPYDILNSQMRAAREAIVAAGLVPSDIAAVGITNQRETTILWDRTTGKPVANAIVWQDRRTADRCEALRANGIDDLVRDRTGLVLDPYFSATKIGWLLDDVPGLRARAERGEIAFGTVDSWLVWHLTGGKRHVTDVTNAARTMLFDIHTLRYDDELLAAFDVPLALMPEVLPCVADFGTALADALGAAIPITGVAGDQHAALFGQSCTAAGDAKCTYGTGSFVMLNTGARRVRSDLGIIATIGYALGPGDVSYALEGSIFSAGATVQWLRDGLGIIASAGELEALARSVPDSDDVFLVPAFSGLGAPYWDPFARAALVGMTRGTTKAHVARAALDSMALQTADVVAAMQDAAGLSLDRIVVDGGVAVNDFAMQLQADHLGCTVARPENVEATALGAGFFAGLGCGLWSDVRALPVTRALPRLFHPALAARSRERIRNRWHLAVERSRNWALP